MKKRTKVNDRRKEKGWNICCMAHYKAANYSAIFPTRTCMRNSFFFLVGLVLLYASICCTHSMFSQKFPRTKRNFWHIQRRIYIAIEMEKHAHFFYGCCWVFVYIVFDTFINTPLLGYLFDKSSFWDDTCSGFDGLWFPWPLHKLYYNILSISYSRALCTTIFGQRNFIFLFFSFCNNSFYETFHNFQDSPQNFILFVDISLIFVVLFFFFSIFTFQQFHLDEIISNLFCQILIDITRKKKHFFF